MNDTERVRTHLASDHADFLQTVATCADRMADEWERPPTDGRAVAAAFEAALRDAGVLDRCPAVLRDAATAVEHRLAADPVAAPPYVTATSVGLVLRAPLPTGRLVVTVQAFAVERGGPGDAPTYARTDADPATSLTVAFRSR